MANISRHIATLIAIVAVLGAIIGLALLQPSSRTPHMPETEANIGMKTETKTAPVPRAYYSAKQLQDWKVQIQKAHYAGRLSFHSWGISERKIAVFLDTESKANIPAIEDFLKEAGIPRDAVIITVLEPEIPR